LERYNIAYLEKLAVALRDNILDEIRVMFSKSWPQHEGKEFFATFSCGIAALSDFKDAVILCSEADKALYAAYFCLKQIVWEARSK
jgi:PleD family two-component response regulator